MGATVGFVAFNCWIHSGPFEGGDRGERRVCVGSAGSAHVVSCACEPEPLSNALFVSCWSTTDEAHQVELKPANLLLPQNEVGPVSLQNQNPNSDSCTFPPAPPPPPHPCGSSFDRL